ncbi:MULTISPECIES: NUDIX domain-containing protein [unclassified Niallia]|uniref:NUDIX domain-containing protein n=1 Tax=Niallia TaxID=2837506 RepID=UPI001EDC85B8|nr:MULTISPECIES: NUDIX domain-containing protein [unclassified Niallia]MCM3032393.1 NUDIX domain-containing protein [Niallia sp. MER 6]UPO90210.1 NUDIX domain-containing protein [Niallia sp. Man26]
MNIRISAKAIIIDNDKLLLTKNQDDEGYFYLFPGGGQEHGETLEQAVRRECLEEVGEQVEVGSLVFIREYIGKNHEHASFDYDFHQVEHYFICNIENGQSEKTKPANPDTNQVGLEWLPIDKLLDYRIYPKELLQQIINYTQNITTPVYLGDIN